MITLKIKLGNSVLEYQETDIKKVHKFSAIYGMLPNKCDNCGSLDIFLNHKSPKNNDYYSLKCKACGAELLFHQKKEGGFFLKQGEKMSVYTKGSDNTDNGIQDQGNTNQDCPW